jgi:uroporphyrinogen-III decarboxylase
LGIVLHSGGGGVDTQKTLTLGTPSDVEEEVRKLVENFGDNGGFVFSGVHNIQAEVPIENVIAMFETIKKYR